MKTKRITALFLSALLLLSFSSCNKTAVVALMSTEINESIAPEHNSGAYIDFALKLVKSAASERGKNAAVSPYSVLSALAVMANAADGNSRAQIENATGYSLNALDSEARYLLDRRDNDETATVKTANSIFIKDGAFSVKENAYLSGADVYLCLNGKNPAKFINELCSENTNGTVKKAVESVSDTDLLILSTFMFDCAWSEIYEDKDVKTRSFKNYDGTETDVKILCSKENIIAGDEYVGFNKKYKNEDYCFTVIMPKDENTDIYDFLQSIDAEKWAQIYADQKGVIVAVRFPEFYADCSADTVKVLNDLGITDVFDSEKADLSGLTQSKTYFGDFIEASRVVISRKSTGSDSEIFKERGTEALPYYDLIFADRPFIFAVTDETTLTPLYIGVIANMADAIYN